MMEVERLERAHRQRKYAEKRKQYLPKAIPNTLARLRLHLQDAEELGVPIRDEWRDAWEALQSRFLTDPKLINREWDREFARARNQGEQR